MTDKNQKWQKAIENEEKSVAFEPGDLIEADLIKIGTGLMHLEASKGLFIFLEYTKAPPRFMYGEQAKHEMTIYSVDSQKYWYRLPPSLYKKYV